jgi:hypothetical protein
VQILLQANASAAVLFVNQSESSLNYQSIDNLMSGTCVLNKAEHKNSLQNIPYLEFVVEIENDDDANTNQDDLFSYHKLLGNPFNWLALHAIPRLSQVVLNQKIFILHESYLI